LQLSPLLANITLDGIENIHKSVRYADDMVFLLKPNDNANEILKQIEEFLQPRGLPYSENDFINVKGDYSPFNGDILYWSKRQSQLYDGATSKPLTLQNHKCGYCGLSFADGEKIHLHHLDGNHHNWKPKNLLAVHRSCHNLIHSCKGK
jgi:RNA-directed DNA polymerase